ncbi:MAG: hypothetical protein GX139_01170 [Armatimonadetes bacterium]|jgi:hypothetical protein|nr:hypothetical protein [Armatimonadota bacterium]
MRFVVAIGLLIFLATGVQAADWQWPAQISLGGFRIVDISGSAKSDGSGSATGTVQIANLGNSRVSLMRTSRGEISGNLSLDTRAVRGSFKVSDRGMQGRGTVECSPRVIDSNSVDINPRGEASGNGNLGLGRLNVNVDFRVGGSSCSANGSAPVRVQADTAVATYKFEGNLAVQGGGSKLSGNVSGRVERTGKLSNQTTMFTIPKTSVDLANGQCVVNVGGVSVTFTLF